MRKVIFDDCPYLHMQYDDMKKFKEACNEHLFLLSDANGEIRDKLLKCQQHTESSTLIFAQKLVEYL